MKAVVVGVNLLLAVALAAAHLFVVLDGRMSARYLGGAIDRSGAYSEVVPVLPGVIAEWAGSDLPAPEKARYREVLAKILTPDYVRDEVARSLGELESVLRREAESAEIHMNDLPTRARAAGFELSEDRFEAIELRKTEMHPQRKVLRYFISAQWGLIAAAVLLLAISLWAGRSWGRLRGLAAAIALAGLLTAPLVAVLAPSDSPAPASNAPVAGPLGMHFDGESAKLLPPLRKVGNRIVFELRLQLGLTAAAAVLGGAALWRWGGPRQAPVTK